MEIVFNDYMGEIAWKFNNLSGLESMNIASRKLFESYLVDLGKLHKVNILLLYNNNLIGFILGNLNKITCMQGLHLLSNMLTELIPKGIFMLIRLIVLHLFLNNVNKYTHGESGDLPRLHTFDMEQFLHRKPSSTTGDKW